MSSSKRLNFRNRAMFCMLKIMLSGKSLVEDSDRFLGFRNGDMFFCYFFVYSYSMVADNDRSLGFRNKT